MESYFVNWKTSKTNFSILIPLGLLGSTLHKRNIGECTVVSEQRAVTVVSVQRAVTVVADYNRCLILHRKRSIISWLFTDSGLPMVTHISSSTSCTAGCPPNFPLFS